MYVLRVQAVGIGSGVGHPSARRRWKPIAPLPMKLELSLRRRAFSMRGGRYSSPLEHRPKDEFAEPPGSPAGANPAAPSGGLQREIARWKCHHDADVWLIVPHDWPMIEDDTARRD